MILAGILAGRLKARVHLATFAVVCFCFETPRLSFVAIRLTRRENSCILFFFFSFIYLFHHTLFTKKNNNNQSNNVTITRRLNGHRGKRKYLTRTNSKENKVDFIVK